ncbi:MAG: hypothetical protein J6K25_15550 [Thermoguttaceae bacterium]|nr:hypothetical protein [Thermoguttaceae bacterium]
MAKDLSRRELQEIVAAYKGGELGGSRAGRFVGGVSSEAVVRNATGALLRSGTPVKISGFAQNLTFDAALSRLLNNKLTLRAVAASADDAPETVGSTLEPIRADGLGRVKLDGLSAARVTFPSGGDDYEYASATFVAAESGPFRILAKSKLSAERVAVCALAKVAATPAPGSAIRAARVATAWTQNETRTEPLEIAYYDAELGREVSATALSPLSRYRDALPVDAQILVAQIADGSWILLNAECPE